MAAPEGLAVALLAAGRSRRFGEADKRTAFLGSMPLIEWAASSGRSINAAQHILVTGPDFPKVKRPLGYDWLVNWHAEDGLSSSLRLAAHRARQDGASALLVLLGDMPLVTAEHLHAIIGAFDTVRPIFSRTPDGIALPPAVFPASLFPALEALAGDNGARGLAGDALFIEASADLLTDVDTPADLERCAARLGY